MDIELKSKLEYTGERMVPEGVDNNTFWEHIYRYRFATKYIHGKDVLDIASGEGYGTAALTQGGSKSVIGVEIDLKSVEHSREKYNIDVRQGDATKIPLVDNSVDVVISFETVEHIVDTSAFISECARVLRPGGMIVISTPNVAEYNVNSDPMNNPYHCSEMTEQQFANLLESKFNRATIFHQYPVSAPRWSISSLRLPASVWRSTRLVWRLRSLSQHRHPDTTVLARANPVNEILRSESFLSRLTNPYVVRSPARNVPVMYLIAVAYVKK